MTNKAGHLAFDPIPDAQPQENALIELPMLLFTDQIILPHTITPLEHGVGKNYAAARYAIEQQSTVICCRYRRPHASLPILEQIHPIGTEVALLDIFSDSTEESMLMMAQGRRRVEVVEIAQETPFVLARARLVEDIAADPTQITRARDELLHDLGALLDESDHFSEDLMDHILDLEDDSELVDTIASALALNLAQRQQILSEPRLDKRLQTLAEWIRDELGALVVRNEVQDQVNDEISRVQREMYLREQMRVIQQELGEADFYEDELQTLRDRLMAKELPQEVHQQAFKELTRLSMMPPITPESSVIRSYLDWILDLPWNESTKDRLNLRSAEKVLDNAHHGLEKVKERILEHIAVRKMAGSSMKAPILCFVGPPGVGKTSVGKSIAEALGRKFVRVSLGGVRDEAEIRGHRRTYIGALPGRVIQAMKRAETVNPVFMLDEIDKLSEDYRGDPASALLEVLDPEQNFSFSDHYLEVPYDLSQVMFIATANELYPLPEALEDRMEVIHFSAYTEEDKLEIAKRFLVPKQLKAHGLQRRSIQFLDSALLHIIRHYTLEAGVRNLEREIAQVCRKITRLVAQRKKYPKRITSNMVQKYLGPPALLDSHLNREDNIGLVTGIVWTSAGGDVQVIEVALLPGKGNLTLTGQLGDVLQESAQIALNYTRWRAENLNIPDEDFENYDVHVHLPEGAVPKEGPSAGITLATAIVSVFTESKVRSDWAMTGEVTLRGHVLPVGGIKEKVLAARRRGIYKVLLPADNEKDLTDLPKKALRGLEIKFVRNMQEVLDTVLYDTPEVRQRDLESADENGNGSASESAEADEKQPRVE